MRTPILVLFLAVAAAGAPKRRAPAVVEKPDGDLVHLHLEEDPAAQGWLCKPALERAEDERVDLIVALHGAGGNPQSYFDQRLLRRRKAWCLGVAGHQAVTHERGSGFQWSTTDARTIADLTRYVVEKYPVREDRVLVWGHSAGGTMTLEALKEDPELFAGGLTTAAPRTPDSNHEDLRVAVFLGMQDPNWSVAPSVRNHVEKTLKRRRKGACAFFAVEGLGHDVPASEYLELGFDWILHGEARGGEAKVGASPQGVDGAYRHLLLRHKGAEGAGDVKRSKSSALRLAKKIAREIGKGRAMFAFEAACHSEDAETASCGGGIEADALEALVGTLPDLEPGELSAPLESPHGIHLVFLPGKGSD